MRHKGGQAHSSRDVNQAPTAPPPLSGHSPSQVELLVVDVVKPVVQAVQLVTQPPSELKPLPHSKHPVLSDFSLYPGLQNSQTVAAAVVVVDAWQIVQAPELRVQGELHPEPDGHLQELRYVLLHVEVMVVKLLQAPVAPPKCSNRATSANSTAGWRRIVPQETFFVFFVFLNCLQSIQQHGRGCYFPGRRTLFPEPIVAGRALKPLSNVVSYQASVAMATSEPGASGRPVQQHPPPLHGRAASVEVNRPACIQWTKADHIRGIPT